MTSQQTLIVIGFVVLNVLILRLLYWLVFEDRDKPRSLADDSSDLATEFVPSALMAFFAPEFFASGALGAIFSNLHVIVFATAFGLCIFGEWYVLATVWPERFAISKTTAPSTGLLFDPEFVPEPTFTRQGD